MCSDLTASQTVTTQNGKSRVFRLAVPSLGRIDSAAIRLSPESYYKHRRRTNQRRDRIPSPTHPLISKHLSHLIQ